MARAGSNVDRIVRAGADLADEVGFDRVTASEVARRFDVKVASLYSHLKSAHELNVGIALLALDELADRVSEALAGRARKDALIAVANVYLDYSREYPGRYTATQFPLDHETAINSAGVRHSAMMTAILRGYDLDETDRVHAIRLLGSIFHGYATLDASGAFSHSSPDSQQSWTRILDGIDTLLQQWRQKQ
ncbi:TetR/AcrR family transcriptional regulator [Rhodococcus sp. ARC_M5]|uniref:TetR/AcrR family transcriptional regulator n=1 Tax=Rhodococcus sp. ARC_M5 TaxID=2928851 RepID=UPI001FB29115|nr:TetR/AcrR family transcriptional regulator [Rhodococcus sp. ARC_M5]MCJ0893100.1 TetR/AcrR family transcriptional regulator [Rhodococcus sp. ARC_M5]